jgi:hypothetical protein
MQAFYFIAAFLVVAVTASSLTYPPCTVNIGQEIKPAAEIEVCKPERSFPDTLIIEYQVGTAGVLDPTVDVVIETTSESRDFKADGKTGTVQYNPNGAVVKRISIKNLNSVFALTYVNVQTNYTMKDTPEPKPYKADVGLIVGLTLGTIGASILIIVMAVIVCFCCNRGESYDSM